MNAKLILVALFVGALSGCATIGREVTTEQTQQFQKGKTTATEVVRALGAPTSKAVDSEGRQTLSYVFSHSQLRAASFIPIVGIFAGGADGRTSVAAFVFSKDGVLIDYMVSQSQIGVSNMGRYQQQTDQPEERP